MFEFEQTNQNGESNITKIIKQPIYYFKLQFYNNNWVIYYQEINTNDKSAWTAITENEVAEFVNDHHECVKFQRIRFFSSFKDAKNYIQDNLDKEIFVQYEPPRKGIIIRIINSVFNYFFGH